MPTKLLDVRGRLTELTSGRSLCAASTAAYKLSLSPHLSRQASLQAIATTSSHKFFRGLMTSSLKGIITPASLRTMVTAPAKKDWNATLYLKFGNERTRPVYDAVNQIIQHITTPNPRIYDLGCGPGNSTKVLLDAFPSAKVTGMDSSPDMLLKARAALPDVKFELGDLATFKPQEDEPVDLLFSNAVFHWLRSPTRIETLARLFKALKPGGVLAIQVPDNYEELSHSLMRDVAKREDATWAPYFKDTRIGSLSDKGRPDLDPIEQPHEFYNALAPHAAKVDIWRTKYGHVLEDAHAIAEWVKGTGLQPYLQRIEDESVKQEFLSEYEARLKEAYPQLVDGKVLLGYPRLFVLAVRK